MTPRHHDAAMIHLGGQTAGLLESRRGLPLDQRAAARGTPVGYGLNTQHGVAVAAYAFHT